MRAGPKVIRNRLGDIIGCVDSISFAQGRVRVEGWSRDQRLYLLMKGGDLPVSDRFARGDVPTGSDLAEPGFLIDAPWDGNALRLACETAGRVRVIDLPCPGLWQRRVRMPIAALQLVWLGLRNAPDVIAAVGRGDEAAHARMRDRLGLTTALTARTRDLPEDLFATSPVTANPGPAATIIVPIYNAFDLLPELLSRLSRHTDVPGRLLLVEDASPDDRVRPFLCDWIKGPEAARLPMQVELLENPENLGFIGSVNRAFAKALEHPDPVILLNSDAMVPAGWAARLLAPLSDMDKVATVTPMSNDAEIFSVPRIVCRSDLAKDQVDALDAVAATLSPPLARADVPTGVGFCMAINRGFLEKLPGFDTAFGKGYGEEVDWCQKARALGGRHIGLASLFVEHRGGASFGSAAKQALVARNNATVARRYPSYDAEVQDFIRADPLSAPRLALGIAWALTLKDTPLPVYLGHSLGGGAEHYLARRVQGDLARYGAVVVVRVGGDRRWRVELHTPDEVLGAATGSTDTLRGLFAGPGARRLIYSCGVGDGDPVGLPAALLDLVQPGRDAIEILFHDYFPVSPSYTLLDKDGHYRGVPHPGTEDAAHATSRPDGTPVSLDQWRAEWGRLVAAAETLVVFSRASRDIVAQAYPQAAERLRLIPHDDTHAVPRIPVPATGKPGIGVLGDIGFQKGAEVVAKLGGVLNPERQSLTIIGRVDPAYAPPDHVTVHGRYALDDLPRLAAAYGIDRWFIPSIWPETFSYTTREAIATGLPVFCFDLGGQAEGVATADNGHLLPLVLADDPHALAQALIRLPKSPEKQTLDSKAAE
ncbi:glycosyltransferase [Fluviibacterium sp. DFM31]|uniref:Glycosyltransferase n=2 Tax=Meridianimarinicoccus marinus TaxID=3231483 RepID=A0ABV3L993_9RHOB